MTLDELGALLESRTDQELVDREILERRPWIFRSDKLFGAWQASVASSLDISPQSVRVVGSAATGYSLSPLKPGRPFGRYHRSAGSSSDIDIAVVDQSLFLSAWDAVVAADRARRLSWEALGRIRKDVYWGLVASRSIPPNTDTARRLLVARATAGRERPLRGFVINCRVYRRVEDLRAYHVNSLRSLRKYLEEMRRQ